MYQRVGRPALIRWWRCGVSRRISDLGIAACGFAQLRELRVSVVQSFFNHGDTEGTHWRQEGTGRWHGQVAKLNKLGRGQAVHTRISPERHRARPRWLS